jgi:hypothetical protein
MVVLEYLLPSREVLFLELAAAVAQETTQQELPQLAAALALFKMLTLLLEQQILVVAEAVLEIFLIQQMLFLVRVDQVL